MYRILPRALVFSLAALVILPVVYYGSQYVSATELYPGDQMEVRTCRWCAGDGVDEGIAMDYPELGSRCPGCLGTGKVKVIIPGPLRPTQVVGEVVDDVAVPDYSDPDVFGNDLEGALASRSEGDSLFAPLTGGIGGVEVIFENQGEGDDHRVKANKRGRFRVKLPPGAYKMRSAHPGFRATSEDLTVAVLTEPIWREKSKLIEAPETFAQEMAWFGLRVQLRLQR